MSKLREWYLVKTSGQDNDGRPLNGCLEAMTKTQAAAYFAKEAVSVPIGRSRKYRRKVIVPGRIRGILVREVKQ